MIDIMLIVKSACFCYNLPAYAIYQHTQYSGRIEEVGKLPGVHAPHRKNTAKMKGVTMPVSPIVKIPMSMHIGAPSRLLVSVGEEVKVGQPIGEAGGFVSAVIHSSVSGVVKSIENTDVATGEVGTFVVISTDGRQTLFENIKPPIVKTSEEFLQAVRESGIVGLGGAGFPTVVKLTVEDISKIDYVIVNGAECEPYITSDTRTMIDDRRNLWEGVHLIRKHFNDPKVLIGIESNKPEAIRGLQELAVKEPIAEIRTLPPIYPQGAEKVLIYQLTGRVVPEGKLPLDIGVVVINCTTLASIGRYIRTGLPLVKKCLTVDGTAVNEPKNVIAPVGTPIIDILKFCGVSPDDAKKILLGGPMMGVAVPSAEAPIKKNTNAVLAFKEDDAHIPDEGPCIRCGRCIAKCPMRLMPVEIQNMYLTERFDLLEAYRPNVCMECGCCAFTCPAGRRLTQYMKLSKAALRNYQAKQKEEEAAK